MRSFTSVAAILMATIPALADHSLQGRSRNNELAPYHWAEGVPDHEDGATRDYYNRAAWLPWRNRLGDWTDAEGKEQGNKPYCSVLIRDTDQTRPIEWNVTDLVRKWVAREAINKGFFLRCIGKRGAIVFASRESKNADERPRLTLTTDRGEVVLQATADTYLTPSTYRPLGNRTVLRVSDEPEHILLRFDLSQVEKATRIGKAALRLYSVKQYGDAEVGVFACAQGEALVTGKPKLGLARRHSNDRQISNHQSVYFAEDFESPQWGKKWSQVAPEKQIAIVKDRDGHGFVPLQGAALRVEIPKGGNTGLNMLYNFAGLTGREPEEVYFRYYLRLGSDWNQTVSDGKLPGIAGTYNRAGWGGRKSDGTNGWSARGLFARTIPPGNPLAGTTPIGTYGYHADMKGNYGDHWVWYRGYRGYLENNRWYCIEHYVKLNTPGKADGVLRGWIDGHLAIEKTNVRFRNTPKLKIEQVWMNVYHGGRSASPRNQHCYIDQVVIASQYIGPMSRED
ncbi:MAG: hypothetical protein KatS3mg105_3071 [Gemmatales bacterium]|nr:MAG: hypothetical protein KatS3mg105_3071 [Gemmatales bacterium]